MKQGPVEQRAAAQGRTGGASRLTLVLPRLCNVYFFITITLVAVIHPQVGAQGVTTKTPPSISLPEGPDTGTSTPQYPFAEVLPGPDDTAQVVLESSGPQSRLGSKFILDQDVVITYGDRKVSADHIEYDTETGELTATGHLKATGGKNNEMISASRGNLNVKTQTGRFYDVTGSVGLKPAGKRMIYANGNPFLFTGRMVVKTGPQEYEIYGGSVTSCQLPHPDWLLYAEKFTVDGEKARATNSVFKLLNIPLLYLPYVTHPVDESNRQSGFLLPVIGQSSTKGLVLGEQIYWAINRSMDLTVGAEYFSSRGWQQSATYRYRGLGNDFVTTHYSGLLDRGIVTGGGYVNQGGQDFTLSGRHDFAPGKSGVPGSTRVVADMEYLSSYTYREAFTENFNQAVSTDILSTAYGMYQRNGYSFGARADRYQGLKRVPTATVSGQQVRIFHAPSLDFDMTEHALGSTGFRWNLEASAAGMKRVEPFFVSSGIIERLDVHPTIAYPLSFGGWRLRPSIGARDTFYSRSRTPFLGPPVELTAPVNRTDVEMEVDLRAPVIERTFTGGPMRRLLRHDVKHTVEPEFTYRYVRGVGNFLNLLRFDDKDVVSNTDELEYGVTQRLFLRPGKDGPCNGAGKTTASLTTSNLPGDVPSGPDRVPDRVKDDGDVPSTVKCGAREWISRRVAQKYFFDETFGGAASRGRRNILESTLNFSGIAFLTEPRAISPLASRLRVRAS
ncbi:hypothetical protein BH10ACI4_BH10ACI4_21420 [soil metagenome]